MNWNDSEGYVIYIYPGRSTFVRKDINLLSGEYEVRGLSFNWTDKRLTPIYLLKQFLFLTRNAPNCLGILVMFGGYWSLLPSVFGKLFNKPTFIILGGTDCVSYPSLDYGSLRKPILSFFIKWSYQLCTMLLPVSDTLVYTKDSYNEDAEYTHQGYRFFFPEISTPHKVIYNGFDPSFFNVDADTSKIPNSFITVAGINNPMRLKLKGIDKVIELATSFRHCTFTVIGVSTRVQKSLTNIPENVTFHSFLTQSEFKKYLDQSEFYLQLSVSEGFPNSLCEAMLCKCIPIGSEVGAIPMIIDETGFIVKTSNSRQLIDTFMDILQTNSLTRHELGIKARQRVVDEFNITTRGKALTELFKQRSLK